jgi:AraC-like DNA-binding protein
MPDSDELLLTEDAGHYPGYRMPLWHNPAEDFYTDRGLGSRFRLVLIEEGAGVIRIGAWRGAFVAPVIFCLNETEQPKGGERHGLRAQALYFHPSVVNTVFDFQNIRGRGDGLAVTELQDRGWFSPFTHRVPGRFRPIVLGPSSARRAAEMMGTVGAVLRAQDDPEWPCRSRSYFIELLMLVSRAFHDPDLADRDSLAEPAQWVDSVIHYLHANYHRKITLTELSRRFNTNRTTLASQFQQATGQSVIAYLRGLRMNVAASILRDTKLSLEEIMQHVGFSDSTHFGRTFRRYSGFTPSQYRRENCWMLRDGGSCPPAAEWDCGSGSS